MDHPDETALIRYVNKNADEEEAGPLEQHLFICTDCLEKVIALRRLCRNFDGLWDRWTAHEHGRLLLRWRIAEALVRTALPEERKEGVIERAFFWLKGLDEDAGMGVRIIVSREGSLAVPLDVPPDLGYDLWRDLSDLDDKQQKNLRNELLKAHDLLADGRWEEAYDSMRAALALNEKAALRCELRFVRREATSYVVQVDGERKAVEVIWEETETDALPCLLLLLPEAEGSDPRMAVPSWSPLSGRFGAAFRDLEEGRYTLCIGPAVPKFQTVI